MMSRRVGFAFVAVALAIPSPSTLAATPRTLVATVEHVSDGDSITALTANSTKLRIRLLGIDAPEVARRTIQTTPLVRFT